MRMWLGILTALIAVAGFGSHAASAYRVSFKGQPPENEKTLRRVASDLRDSIQVVDSLSRLLVNAGYLEAQVTLLDSAVMLKAGPAALLGALEITGDSAYRVSIGRTLTQAAMEHAAREVLRPQQDEGYWYATLHLQGLRISDRGEVAAEARLSRGPVVTIGDVSFPGLMHTRPELVGRYLPVQVGDTLTPGLLSRFDRAASALDLIRPSGPAEVVPMPGYRQALIRLPVEEPRQFAFEGAVGLAGDATESRVPLWSLRLQVNSLFGYGRRLTLHTQRPDPGRHDLTLGYRQPVFLLGPGRLEGDLVTRDYQDQFYEFAVGANVTTSLSRGVELGFGLGWKTVSPESERPTFDRYDLAMTFSGYDVDDRLNPSSGWRTDWRITFSHRRYGSDTLATAPSMMALDETRVEMAVDRYQPIWRGWLVHIRLSYDGLQTREELPPLSELALLGGPTTVRGFRSEQFPAFQAVWGTIEPRLRSNWGYASTFVDAAYLRNRVAAGEDIVTDEDFEYGYGIGLGLTGSRAGVSISLAWNPVLAFDQPYLAVRFNSEL